MYNSNKMSIITLLIIIILVAGLGLINIKGVEIPYFNWLEKGIFNITSPVINVFSKVYNTIYSYYYGITSTDELIAENRELENEVARLKRKIQQLETHRRQNRRLRELLAFKRYVHYKIRGASVIGYGPSNWQQKIIIDRGKDDGIAENMPVISYNGCLVGRIDYVGAKSSQVKLIYDPEFVVGGIVQREDSRAIGLVRGQSNNKRISIMEKIDWDADIKKDDLILTSGLSDNYPQGLPIGRVLEVEPDNYGLSQKARIELFASLRTIEEVLVITDY